MIHLRITTSEARRLVGIILLSLSLVSQLSSCKAKKKLIQKTEQKQEIKIIESSSSITQVDLSSLRFEVLDSTQNASITFPDGQRITLNNIRSVTLEKDKSVVTEAQNKQTDEVIETKTVSSTKTKDNTSLKPYLFFLLIFFIIFIAYYRKTNWTKT